MRAPMIVLLLAGAALIGGCYDDTTAPHTRPPAAPRGVYSVTGDHEVILHWLENTERDVVAYRIYEGPCANGPSCPYTRVAATTGTSYRLGGLANGATRYFAVSAVDADGNESALSYDTVFDTPRPEGTGATLLNFLEDPDRAAWDFSAQNVRSSDDPSADVFFGYDGRVFQMFAIGLSTDIQDAGFASSLDAVDFAPLDGWSPTGTVELVVGHCYVVWTRDDHYAKFRVTRFIDRSPNDPAVQFDWAYQVDTGNRELKARPAREGRTAERPISWIR